MKVKLDTIKLFYRLILQGEPLFKVQQTMQIGKGVYCTRHEYGLLSPETKLYDLVVTGKSPKPTFVKKVKARFFAQRVTEQSLGIHQEHTNKAFRCPYLSSGNQSESSWMEWLPCYCECTQFSANLHRFSPNDTCTCRLAKHSLHIVSPKLSPLILKILVEMSVLRIILCLTSRKSQRIDNFYSTV